MTKKVVVAQTVAYLGPSSVQSRGQPDTEAMLGPAGAHRRCSDRRGVDRPSARCCFRAGIARTGARRAVLSQSAYDSEVKMLLRDINIYQDLKAVINHLKRNCFLLAENRNKLNEIKSLQVELKSKLEENQTMLRENREYAKEIKRLIVEQTQLETKRADEIADDLAEIKKLLLEKRQ